MKYLLANRKLFAAGFLLTLLLAGIAYNFLNRSTRSTENAYVQADVVNVASQVSGSVITLHITNNQSVHKGDALFDIDPAPYQIALERAQANLLLARQSAAQENADIDVAKAQVEQSESDLANSQRINTRDRQLVDRHFMSEQALDDDHTRMQGMQAQLAQSRAKLNRARAAPGNLAERGDILKAQAAIAQAQLDLQHTHVTAAQDGQISNFSLTAGTMVSAGAPLFALIKRNSFHIDANFKETQLSGIHPGQRVDIRLDMYPGQTFQGTVQSISGGTGTAFSLLPPQNATGNWVKIAQRVPVRIAFSPTDSELRIGATATVTVHLK